MTISFEWRGEFNGEEANRLHADAFGHRVYEVAEWDWPALVSRHSLGWVTVRDDDELVGFANVVWDGLVHAWIQDVMVASVSRNQGIGREVVAKAVEGARAAGCEWLHVDFDDDLRGFYIDDCGFTPTNAGLIRLSG